MSTSALSVKQRRFVAEYVSSGNGTQAALAAYDTEDPHTAHAIASENLRKPVIQDAVNELLDAEGLSDAKLLAIHAHYLSLCASADPRLKALGLKALDMAYKLKGAYAPERHRIETEQHLPAEAIEQLTRVLREVQEFEHPELNKDPGERLGHSALVPSATRGIDGALDGSKVQQRSRC
jgi:hypothetical protein